MPKKTLHRPYKVPPPRVCRDCGKNVRQRDILDGHAKQVDDCEVICPYCVSNADTLWTKETSASHGSALLKETKDTRQFPGEPFRRWFKNDNIDLIVWLDDYRILGFQLILPSDSGQIAITWHKGEGISVYDVDDGEGRSFRPKMTPILKNRHDFDAASVLTVFKGISDGLPDGLAEVIERKISKGIKEKKR